MPQRIACKYCNTANPPAKYCVACGAPLPEFTPVIKTQHIQTGYRSTPIPQKELESIRKTGEKMDRAFFTGAYIYSAFWRTLAESIVIAVVGCATGFLGGATGVPAGGIIGSSIIGLAVGIAIKISYITYLSAPAGFIVGAVLCVLLWFLKIPPQAMVFITTLFSALAALIGRRRIPFSQRNLWEKIRPFLGALGGLIFGILGMLIGLGLRSALLAILNKL